ncbi:hypothetical protein [Agrilutibacter solisilvae]|uniref:Uncharacterized protein n=1 Tax=Agrilutibacter solisilvae TaxID=2763317 RepID=A0A974XYD5_9GAMM|nr:hypothetical protein [Lysobacter solisilvae]QSX78062.1 hypothetical protein I8J32_015340 [Lysobacter solisilvae]
MLHEFLTNNQEELIARCRAKVARRAAGVGEEELEHGVTVFLEQLIRTLRMEQTSHPSESRKVSGAAGGGKPALSEIGESASQHGRELLQRGYTIEEVVHDYGDVCQGDHGPGVRARRSDRGQRVPHAQPMPGQCHRQCRDGVRLPA